LNTNPSNAGSIKCNNEEVILNSNLNNLFLGSKCIAKSNSGFHFSSWIEDLGNNASRTINSSSTSSNNILEFFFDRLGLNSTDNNSILTLTQSGHYIANFVKIPSPIPTEYLVGLYSIIVTTIIGWSIPSIISSIKSRREISMFNCYHKLINNIYKDNKLDNRDLLQLNTIKGYISDAYAKGKISTEHYSNLKDEISILFQELFKEKINSLKSILNIEDKEKQVGKVKDEITDAYSKGKLTELHYNLLKERIESLNTTN